GGGGGYDPWWTGGMVVGEAKWKKR
ncbi:hypothetical protein EE612_012426, partial [Oryza sativa]